MAIKSYVVIEPYADLTFANAYMDDQLPTRTAKWYTVDDTLKLSALKEATQWIDTLNFVGYKNGEDTQIREFPRNDEDDIPLEVSMCCAETALAILNGASLERMLKEVGISSEGIGDTSRSYEIAGSTKRLELFYGLPSPLAARYIVGWLKDPDVINLDRVS